MAAEVHSCGLAIYLGQKRAKKFAAAGSAGSAGLGPKIDIDDLPTEACEPKLLVDQIERQSKDLLRLTDEVRARDMS
ncbi:hypothetical protein FALCPG4_001101 [Fusarium falciforme]